MENSKLIAFLLHFDAKARRRFREYLCSPFFNKRQDLIEFYAALLPFLESKLELERLPLWHRYAPGRPLNEKELGYLMNFLLKAAENFVAMESFQEDNVAKGIRQLQYHLEHGLDKHYRAVLQRTRKNLDRDPFRDAEWQLKAWRLADAEVQHFYRSKSRSPDQSLRQSAQHLDHFYLDKRLEIIAEVLNLNKILQAELETRNLAELEAMAAQQEPAAPTVQIRAMLVRLLKHPDDASAFKNLRDLLPQSRSVFPDDKVKGIFAYAQNFCIRRIKAGAKEFQSALFEIYQESINSGVMYEDGSLNPWNFKNVCTIGLQLGAFDWVEAFIQEKSFRIRPEHRATAIAYNQAQCFFYQGAFDSALRQLQEVSFEDVFYALDTRRLQTMVYFERSDWAGLESLLLAFRAYLQRNRILSDSNRKAYLNFVEWIGRIALAQEKDDQEGLRNFLGRLKEVQPLVARDWLVGCCEV